MADTTVDVSKLAAAFRQVGDSMRLRVARVVAFAGASVLRATARRLASGLFKRRSGALLSNIAVKREVRRAPPGAVEYDLGVRHGKNLTRKAKAVQRLSVKGGRIVSRYVNNPIYWLFLERGWTPRSAANPRRSRGVSRSPKVPGRPFIGASLPASQDAVLRAMEDRLEKELRKGAAT